jgi:hypothetical protein
MLYLNLISYLRVSITPLDLEKKNKLMFFLGKYQ